jgi:two-component system, NarL family, invasion response regulator UvrY
MSREVSVLIIDDHAMIRRGCRQALTSGGFTVVGEADCAEAGLRLYTELHPDVLVLDISMPGISGLETLRRLQARVIDPAAVVLSMHDDITIATRALRAGARAYVTKTSSPECLLEAVRRVAAGEHYLSPDIASRLALSEFSVNSDPLSVLTKREFEVFHMLVKGRRPGQIAESLSLSAKAVSNYQQKIKAKLRANNVAELVHIALECGLEKPRA